MSALEHVTAEAEKLDRHSQFILVERLARQLGRTTEHRDAWSEESKRRAESYDRGEIEAIDAEDVFKNLRNLIGK